MTRTPKTTGSRWGRRAIIAALLAALAVTGIAVAGSPAEASCRGVTSFSCI